MIFSSFFKQKWQHKDSTIRITAIENDLSVNNSEQNKILLELAEHDESDLVKKAALIKLNNFDVWLNAAKSSNKSIAKLAEKQIALILHNQHTLTLTVEQKHTYLANSKALVGLENWLQIEQEPSLVIALYKKINKPQLTTNLFTQKKIPEFQQYIIEQTDKIELLEKLLKKAANNQVSALITNKISSLKLAAEKPVKVKKSTQLVLSKLLALSDVALYEDMVAKQKSLTQEWQSIQVDLECLTLIERDEFIHKYDAINKKLAQIFAKKAEDYQQKLIADNIEREKAEAKIRFEVEIEKINKALSTAIFENTDIDEVTYASSLEQLNKEVKASVLTPELITQLSFNIEKQLKRIEKLPVIAEQVSNATHLISKISQLALPTDLSSLQDKEPLYYDWLKQWKAIHKKADGILPDSIINAYKEISQQWKKALTPLQGQQKSLFFQTQRKLSEVSSLIAQGKFNAAFGVFKKAERLHSQLSDSQQSRLEREHTAVKEKMADIADWEHYIATPRKQQLLSDIEQLVVKPMDNPIDQANKVKEFRKLWNSLGHADDEIERTLNEQFNVACEKAFAPCRQFYQEQEDLRKQHLIAREKIILQANEFAKQVDLSSSDIDWKQLENKLTKLQKAWRNAGEVDKEKYKSLQQSFNQLLMPIKTKISQYHEVNKDEKELLIKKATAQLDENVDVFAAADTLKSFQANWQGIGYSGVKNENRLWQTFRKVNDEVFAKRDKQLNEQKDKQQGEISAIFDQLAEIDSSVKNIKDINALQNFDDELSQLSIQTREIKPTNKKLFTKIESLSEIIANQIKSIHSDKKANEYIALFDSLHLLASGNTLEECSDLTPTFWRKKLADTFNKTNNDLREQQTLVMEIYAGVESPESLKSERMALQIKLMQDRMVSSEKKSNDELLVEWVAMGKFTENDLSLIERIKPIFVKN